MGKPPIEVRKSLEFKTNVRVGQVVYWNGVNATKYSGIVSIIHYVGITYKNGLTADITFVNVRQCS